MQSQSFCEDKCVTPKGVWSWDWRICVIIPYSLCLEKKKSIILDIQSLLLDFIQENDVHNIYKCSVRYTSYRQCKYICFTIQ